MTPPRFTGARPVSDKALKPLPYLARNWKFESTPLQRRVCKPSVPRQRHLLVDSNSRFLVGGDRPAIARRDMKCDKILSECRQGGEAQLDLFTRDASKTIELGRAERGPASVRYIPAAAQSRRSQPRAVGLGAATAITLSSNRIPRLGG